MADRVEVFDITIPAATPKTVPLSVATPFSDATLTEAEMVFPSGCAGLVGMRLDYGDVQLLPKTAGAFVRGDGEVVKWPIANMPSGAGWVVTAYNTDTY